MKKRIIIMALLLGSMAKGAPPHPLDSIPKNDSLWFAPYLNLSAYSGAIKACTAQYEYMQNSFIVMNENVPSRTNYYLDDKEIAAERVEFVQRKITIELMLDMPNMDRAIRYVNKDSLGAFANPDRPNHFFVNPKDIEKYCDVVYMMAFITSKIVGLTEDERSMLRSGYVPQKGKAKFTAEQLYAMQWQVQYALEKQLCIWKMGDEFTQTHYKELLLRMNEISSGAQEFIKVMTPEALEKIFSTQFANKPIVQN